MGLLPLGICLCLATETAIAMASDPAYPTPPDSPISRPRETSKNEESNGQPPAPPVSRQSQLERVEVTGSRIKRIDAEGPAPVNVYTAQDIERSGQPSLERFLSGLTEVSASAGEGGFASTLGQGTVQLRGLPLGSTLVLINGRRVQAAGSSGANFFNLNLIPMAAIERVEILPLGSSAVYGGDALAGVVNVILKKAMDGQSLSARVGGGRGFDDRGLSAATGGHDKDGSYLLMASYSRATPLTMAQREFFRDADYTRFGGVDARRRNCTPGTVSSTTGGNLPGLNASFAAIPTLAAGSTLKVSDFQATAGTANLCSLYANGNGFTLVHGSEIMAVHGLAEHVLLGSWSAFGEVSVAKERLHSREISLPLSRLVVGASNPFNPFGEAVSVQAFLGPENGSQGFARQTRFGRVVLGVRGELGAGWDAELTATTSQDRGGSQGINQNVDRNARAAALLATTPETALNPFTTGRAASEQVLRAIWSDVVRQSRGGKDQVAGLVRGTLLQLPAGGVEASFGAEAARDRYKMSIPVQSVNIDTEASNSAAYGEVRAPLLKGIADGRPGWTSAAVTLAARRDHYSDFGSANTYQAGLELRPMRSLLARASTASSFKPPTMLQTHIDPSSDDIGLYGLVDPARGGEAVTSGVVVRETNKDLRPERGQAKSFGLVWEPEGELGSRFSATRWTIQIKGMIAVLGAQAALNYESLFPGFVTREPSINGQAGRVTRVKWSEVNFGSVDTAGTDVDADYRWRSEMGKWSVSAGATRTSRYRVVLAPGAASQDRLGLRFDDYWAPRWKGRASMGLETPVWSVGLTSRYLGHYKDSGSSGRGLGRYWIHDLSGSVNLKRLWPGLAPTFKAATLAATVANLMARDPQYTSTDPYYDVTQADWRGRYASVRVTLDW